MWWQKRKKFYNFIAVFLGTGLMSVPFVLGNKKENEENQNIIRLFGEYLSFAYGGIFNARQNCESWLERAD